MGVIKRGILGGFSGKVANVIGSSWKGIAVMKSMPLSVANPNTAAQITQRTKMSFVVEFSKLILAEIIKPLNDRFASGMSGVNLFVQRNIANFNVSFSDVPADIILSVGTLTPCAIINGDVDVSPMQTTLNYTDNTGDGDALATDVLYVIAVNKTRESLTLANTSTRLDGFIQFDTPEGTLAGDSVELLCSFRRADGTRVSNTEHLTVVAHA